CPVEATVKLSSWLDKAAAAASNLAMLASLMRLGLSVGSGWLGELSPASEGRLASGHSESISSVEGGALFDAPGSADAADARTSAAAAGSSPRAQSSSMSAVGSLAVPLLSRPALSECRKDFPVMNL